MCFYESITTGAPTFNYTIILYGEEINTGNIYAQIFRRDAALYTIKDATREAKEDLINSTKEEVRLMLDLQKETNILHFNSDSFRFNDNITIIKNIHIKPNTFREEDLTAYPPWYGLNDKFKENWEHLAAWTKDNLAQ